MTENLEALEQDSTQEAYDPEAAASAQDLSASGDTDPVVIRRARTSRFLPTPPPTADSGVVVGRGFLNSKSVSQKPQISRERKIAGDLPSWDPLPPGEIAVRRRARE